MVYEWYLNQAWAGIAAEILIDLDGLGADPRPGTRRSRSISRHAACPANWDDPMGSDQDKEWV